MEPRAGQSTKTYENRTVDLTPALAHTLQRHLAWIKADALRRGHGTPEWLFPNEAGHTVDKWKVGCWRGARRSPT